MRDQARAFTRAVGCIWMCVGGRACGTAREARAAAQPRRSPQRSPIRAPSCATRCSRATCCKFRCGESPSSASKCSSAPTGRSRSRSPATISAIGKTVEELRRELVERLGRYIPDLVVTVTVLEIRGNKIYVIGQVNTPGEFIVNPRVDVMQALSLAGGTTAFASPSEIFVLRRDNGQQRRLPFNFDAVLRGRDLEQNVLLRTGDVVVVP